MISKNIFLRVQYNEVDKMGYVYYGHYAKYFEVARVELFRSMGISYKSMEDQRGLIMPVRDFSCRYIKPNYYDDLLKITTEVKAKGLYELVFYHKIFNPQEILTTKAQVVLVLVDKKEKKISSFPKDIKEKLDLL